MEITNNKNNLATQEAVLGANNDSPAIQKISVYPAVVTADLSGAAIASMRSASWHQSYHYDLIVQPYKAIHPKNFYAADGNSTSPATRYLIRATKYLMGKMEMAFYVMPVPEGDKIMSLGCHDQADVAFEEYVSQHLLCTAYTYGKGFMPDEGEAVIEPVGGSLVAFCFDHDHGSDNFDLLVQPHQPALVVSPTATRFVVRATHSSGFEDESTAFYEMPLSQGEEVLGGNSDLERTALFDRLAKGQGHPDLPASSRWPLLLGRDDLHKDIDRSLRGGKLI